MEGFSDGLEELTAHDLEADDGEGKGEDMEGLCPDGDEFRVCRDKQAQNGHREELAGGPAQGHDPGDCGNRGPE